VDLLPLSTLKPSCSRRALAAHISGESRFNLSSNFFAHSVESTSDFGGSLAGDGEIGTVIGVQTFLGDAESAGTACTVFEGEDVVAAPDEEAATDL
jgi:hypothetical protein